MILYGYNFYIATIFAVDSGTTVAIVLALFTLLGTVSANVVAWNKIRMDSKVAHEKMSKEHQRSNVEIAQDVMSQTVLMLNDRLKEARIENEQRIDGMTELHAREIELLKKEHERDIKRLERKIEYLEREQEACKLKNSELVRELAKYKEG